MKGEKGRRGVKGGGGKVGKWIAQGKKEVERGTDRGDNDSMKERTVGVGE